jgi:hypothetical protein
MFTFIRMLLVAGRLILAALALVFQTTVDPSGHWEGTIKVPNMDAKIEIDLQKNSKGEMAGTFGHPAEALKGLPLRDCRGRIGPLRGQGRSGPGHVPRQAVRRWRVDVR